jgi:hypothetical protein
LFTAGLRATANQIRLRLLLRFRAAPRAPTSPSLARASFWSFGAFQSSAILR